MSLMWKWETWMAQTRANQNRRLSQYQSLQNHLTVFVSDADSTRLDVRSYASTFERGALYTETQVTGETFGSESSSVLGPRQQGCDEMEQEV